MSITLRGLQLKKIHVEADLRLKLEHFGFFTQKLSDIKANLTNLYNSPIVSLAEYANLKKEYLETQKGIKEFGTNIITLEKELQVLNSNISYLSVKANKRQSKVIHYEFRQIKNPVNN
jgi:hypothetical protein